MCEHIIIEEESLKFTMFLTSLLLASVMYFKTLVGKDINVKAGSIINDSKYYQN